MKIDDAYLIFKDDFKSRNWIEWIKSHLMFGPPPYRFKGSIIINHYGLTFMGYDSYTKQDAEFTIRKNQITQLYHGYDATFSQFQTRGMGLTWAPVRITFEPMEFNDNETETDVYIVAKFNGVFSENQTLFEELKRWFS